jgi:hypothetical protein
VWFDNFSKIISHRTPKLLRGAWSGCLWTGVAIVKFFAAEGSTVNMEFVYNEGELVWAMPPRLASEQMMVLGKVIIVSKKTKERFDTSLCCEMKVNCVPLKPKAPPGDVRLAKLLAQSRDGCGNFYPESILAPNIGSNLGLMAILKGFCDERDIYTAAGPGRYYMINCDINIYNRILRVCCRLCPDNFC